MIFTESLINQFWMLIKLMWQFHISLQAGLQAHFWIWNLRICSYVSLLSFLSFFLWLSLSRFESDEWWKNSFALQFCEEKKTPGLMCVCVCVFIWYDRLRGSKVSLDPAVYSVFNGGSVLVGNSLFHYYSITHTHKHMHYQSIVETSPIQYSHTLGGYFKAYNNHRDALCMCNITDCIWPAATHLLTFYQPHSSLFIRNHMELYFDSNIVFIFHQCSIIMQRLFVFWTGTEWLTSASCRLEFEFGNIRSPTFK